MDSGFYAATTALMAQSQALELVANNLANSSTAGHRAQRSVFRSLLAGGSGFPISELNRAANDYGVLEGSQVDLSQGNLQHTGSVLDFAIEGPGFFAVQTPAGKAFTRNGSFHVANGQLVTSQGHPVLGTNGPIPIIDQPLSVSADGTISVKGAIAGKLSLTEFQPGTQLQSIGETYYSAPAGSEAASAQSSVRQGTLESSNVNPIGSVVDLITVQRSAELMQRALSMFHSDLNRIATEDLPRVG